MATRAERVARRRARRAARRAGESAIITDFSPTYSSVIFTKGGGVSISAEEQAKTIWEEAQNDGGGGGGSSGGGGTPAPTPTPTPSPGTTPGTTIITPSGGVSVSSNELSRVSETRTRSRDDDFVLEKKKKPEEGLIFLKADEAEDRGIYGFSSRGGEVSESQRRVEFADLLIGREPGSSGAVGVPESSLSFVPQSIPKRLVDEPFFKSKEELTLKGFGQETKSLWRGESDVVGDFAESWGLRRTKAGRVTEEVLRIVPGSSLKQAVIGGAIVGGLSVAPAIISIPTTGYFTYQFGKEALDPTLTSEKRIASGILAVGAGIGLISESYGFARTGFETKIVREVPTEFSKSMVEPFSRQRATLLLKEEPTGKYILGKTKSGEAISIGGGIEKGQTPKQALIAELKQETGLKASDIIDLKFEGKQVFPEETFHVYTGSIRDFSLLKAGSDIQSFVKVSPNVAKNLLGKPITGQTKFFPTSRDAISFSFVEGFKIENIRSYELGLIAKQEYGIEPTWLTAKAKGGDVILGTQSRYNVPFKQQSKYAQEDVLNLVHGTPQAPALKNIYSPGKKGFEIDVSQSVRGGETGLYVQPPISLKTEAFVYRKGFDLKKASGEDFSLFKSTEIIGGEAYGGLSYLGIGTGKEIVIVPKVPKRAFYLFEEPLGKSIIQTRKAKGGKESEFLITGGNVEFTGFAETFYIGGKKVGFQPSKLLQEPTSTSISLKEINKGLEGYGKGYDYISYGELTRSFFKPVSSSKGVLSSMGKSMKENYKTSSEYGRNIFKEISFYPSSKQPSRGDSYTSLFPTIDYPSYEPPYKPPRKPPLPPLTPKKKLDIGFDNPFKDLVATRKFKRTPSLFSVKAFEEFGVTSKQLSTGFEQTGLFERAGVIKPIKLGSLLGKVKTTKGRKK